MIFTSSCCDNLSIDEIIERAEKGDCEAQYIVGFYYNRDSAIDSPDDEKAFYWLKLAAEPGNLQLKNRCSISGNVGRRNGRKRAAFHRDVDDYVSEFDGGRRPPSVCRGSGVDGGFLPCHPRADGHYRVVQ